ncbi:MAG: TetR/AcrR family transcriptional regulator [Actinobacteria bacterium]|nr:TetR/AcrR family transcriptional regulator [Actinomycetota bacterium]
MGMRVGAARRRVTKGPEERRGELFEAARTVFRDKGVRGATVADITDAAGVAKGTFYLYFDSKEALLGGLKQRFADDLVAEASRFFGGARPEDWWAVADATVESLIDFVLGNRDLIQVFAQEGLTPDGREVFSRANERLGAMFSFAIKAGIEGGVFDAADPELAASFLKHAFYGTLEQGILYGQEIDRDRLVAAAEAFMRKVLSPGPPGEGRSGGPA